MTEVTFGSQVSSIGANAFVDCYNLRKITFLGDAPTMNQGTLASVTATAYYPAENTTWTEEVMAGYGGKITWVACSATIVDRWNVVLESDLKVNFYLDINEHNSVKITLGDDCRIYNASDLEQSADGKYIATVNVSAAQMTDDILIQNTGHPDSHSYSIRSYCEAILANEQYSRYHDLVRELLHYGAMAQVYFDHHTENLADSGITGTAAIEIPETADELIIRDHITNLSFYGASLVYENRIAVRYYFTGDITGCSFTANGITYTPVAKDDKYYVEIADILPQNIDQQITFTVTDANGKTLTLSYSPMNYIIRMNNTDDGNRKNLLKALYNYHLAAKAFSIAV